MNIKIEGMQEIVAQLMALQKLDWLRAALQAAGAHVKGKIAKYPQSGLANDPGARAWYQRGYGSKWRVKSGAIHGSKTSETLGRRWTIATKNDGLTVIIGNNASYAKYVQGEEQAAFHGAHGWKTTEMVAEAEAQVVNSKIRQYLLKMLRK